jgi:putative multiple sugar transport system permease protein
MSTAFNPDKIKRREALSGNIRKYTMFIAFFVIAGMFQILTNGVLLVPQNVNNLIQQNSYILILSIGMLLCIITGGNIDLSVGSVVAFIGAISAKLCITGKVDPITTIIIVLLLGTAIGAMNGYFIAYRKVPSFITTLAGMLIFRGLTLVALAGRTLAPFPPAYQTISTGFLPDFFLFEGLHLTSVIIGALLCPIILFFQIKNRREKTKFNVSVQTLPFFIIKQILTCAVILLFAYWLALYAGIPSVLLLLVILYGIYEFFTTRTVPGRHLYALGGNALAAALSGIKTKRMLFFAFTNMGLLSAVAGIVFAGRLNAATPKAGSGFELDAIAACYIGGASSTGGFGTVSGAIIGGLIMGLLNNGMSIMGINVDWQQAIKGVVLLIAVLLDISLRSKSSK